MSYWAILQQAAGQLEQRRFAAAEESYLEAVRARERSPGRVFLTEKVGDALRRAVGALGRRREAAGAEGRWQAAQGDFRRRFQDLAEETVREALRLGDLLPEELGPGQQDVLEAGLFLLTGSRLFTEELAPAVPLTKALFRAAMRTGRLFPSSLLRHDLPFAEEDRLWLARKGDELLLAVGADAEAGAGVDRARWGEELTRLLAREYFGTASRLQEERCWMAAVLTDRHLASPEDAVDRYREYCRAYPDYLLRVARARIRLVELLANVDGQHFPVPRYAEALREIAAAPEPGTEEDARRLEGVLRVIDWRRPERVPPRAWISAGPAAGGGLACVYWWDDEPRDVAFWRPGAAAEDLREFAAPAAGRCVWRDEAVRATLEDILGERGAGWPVEPFVAALLEPQLPADGLTEEATRHLAMSCAGSWRESWDARRGHPALRPPRSFEPDREGPADAEEAVSTGLLWLACLARVRAGDDALRAGVRRLARLGDPAGAFLDRALACGEPEPVAEEDAGWILPPLSLRPAPRISPARGRPAGGAGPRPDLAGSRVAVVGTGRPADVIQAWAADVRRWRLVLDDPGRLDVVDDVVGGAGGIATLIPPGGVHRRDAALARLEELIAAGRDGRADEPLLALLHWVRLVETHNGDLLDHLAFRPRDLGRDRLHARYEEMVRKLPRVEIDGDDGGDEIWAHEYRERARRSRVVAGCAADLVPEAATVDALWGLEAEAEAAWIFLDGAAVHWRLWRMHRDSLRSLHEVLAARGRRHLSLLAGGAFLREALEEILSEWLEPYGRPYFLTLGDARPPLLDLAVGGLDPDARLLVLPALAGQIAHVRAVAAGEGGAWLAAPERGRLLDFWQDFTAGRFAPVGGRETARTAPALGLGSIRSPEGRRTGRLLVPVLESLDEGGAQVGPGPDPAGWTDGGRRRAEHLAWQARLLALEVAALLAADVERVDICDARWWRRVPLPTGGGAVPASPREAARALAEGLGRPYDLAEDPWVTADRDTTAVLRQWLVARGWLDEDGHGHPPGPILAPVAEDAAGPAAAPGIRLHLDGGARAWARLATWLCGERERGRPEIYVLVIGDRPPPGAAEILAAYPASGEILAPAGAAPPDLPAHAPVGALVWLRPADLAAAAVQARLRERPPAAVIAGDLRDWLPGEGRGALAGAAALRWMLSSGIPRLEVFASHLPPGWPAYLEEYWRSEVRQGQVSGRGDAARALLDGESPPIALGRLPAWEVACPGCGATVAIGATPRECERCGLDHEVWRDDAGAAGEARRLLRLKLQALRERCPHGREEPLQVWVPLDSAAMVADLLREIDLEHRDFAFGSHVRLPDGRQWQLAPRDRIAAAGHAPHALLAPPSPQLAEFASLGIAHPPISCWFHARELTSCGLPPAAEQVRRCLGLLAGLDAVLADAARAPERPLAGQEHLPPALLAALTGLPAADLERMLATLRWCAVLAGDLEAPAPSAEHGRPHLEVLLPYAEIEHRAARLAGTIRTLLPLLLSGLRPGVVGLCDLALPPARVAAEDLLWFDRFLIASSRRLSSELPGSPAADPDTAPDRDELLYEPAAGILFSTRRRVGFLGSLQGVRRRLEHHLELSLAETRHILESAEVTPGGWLIPLEGVDRLEADTLELGCLLGFWQWIRPGVDDERTRRHLGVLARTDVVRGRGRTLRLLHDLAADRQAWECHLRRCLSLGLLEPLPAREPSPRPAWTLRGEERAERAAARLEKLAVEERHGVLVLRGRAGTGRLSILVEGLGRALAAGLSAHAVTFYCPDDATAARAHLAWRRAQPTIQPRILVVDADPLPEAGGVDQGLRAGGAQVVAMLEAQRMPADARYRIGQLCRPGVLALTVDDGELAEPWENLFLTTPRTEDVVALGLQLRQARHPHREVRQLDAGLGPVRDRVRRREKGEVRSQWAATLDECLVLLEGEREAGRLAPETVLVAPKLEDLDYLGRRLRDAGWRPVYRQDVDRLLAPGPLEFLAALYDVVEGETVRLGPLLGEEARRRYADWRGHRAFDPETATVAELYEDIAHRGWSRDVLADPAARRRVEALVADAAEDVLASFAGRPFCLAWREVAAPLSGLDAGRSDQPGILLAPLDAPPGRTIAGCVYICKGTETDDAHYRVLSRSSDRLLVIYQIRSPLPQEREDGTG